MYLEDGFTLLDIGQFDVNLTVETAGTQQGAVEDIGSVGGSHHYDTVVGPETVHFGKQLVKRVFTFIVGVAQSAMTASATNGVNLIDKDNAG